MNSPKLMIVLAFLSFPSSVVSSSPIKEDETSIFFPTNAYLDANWPAWVIPVHGWIFEMEEGPEIFAVVASLYPDQVLRVLIRDAAASAADRERYQILFQDMPKSWWSVFRDGSDLSTINVAEKADHDAL